MTPMIPTAERDLALILALTLMIPTAERDRTMTHTTEKDLNSMIQATVRGLNLIPMTQ